MYTYIYFSLILFHKGPTYSFKYVVPHNMTLACFAAMRRS